MHSKNFLEKYPELRKVGYYLASLQREDGTFPGLKPNPIATMYGLGLLLELGKKPVYQSTTEWVMSLQTGKRGFGETTGQNSWDYTTYHGSEMHKHLGIKPRYEKDFINFVNSHQNSDGGFSKVGEKESNLSSTLFWAKSLINLGYDIKDVRMLETYLRNCADNLQMTPYQAYHSIGILNKISETDRQQITTLLNKIRHNVCNLAGSYFLTEAYNLIGRDAGQETVARLKTSLKNYEPKNLEEAFFSAKILNNLGIDFDRDYYIRYTRLCELEQGGFYNPEEKSILSAYEAVQSARLLGINIERKKLLSWVKSQQLQNRSFENNCKLTFWATRTLKLLGQNPDGTVTPFLDSCLSRISPYDSFYTTYTCSMIEHLPKNYRSIITGLLKLQNHDGGFSLCKEGRSEMYETYRSCQTIKNLADLLDQKRMIRVNWLSRIKKQVIDWVNSCEHHEGGYSWVPGEKAYIQPTYQALHTLLVFEEQPKDLEMVKEFILSSQNEDGGFNGGEKNTPSMLLYMYYSLASLAILDAMGSGNNKNIATFLGL